MVKKFEINDIEFAMDNVQGTDSVCNYIVKHGASQYEYPLPEIVEIYASKYPGIYIDAGANTGLFSLILAKANTKNTVIAFECLSQIAKKFQKNISLNRLKKRILLEEIALSDKKGFGYFKETNDDPGFIPTCSTFVEPIDQKWEVTTHKVQTDTIDNQLKNLKIKRKVKLMKVDVEGFEESVLKGSEKTIQKHRPIIIVELLKETNFHYFNEFIEKNDYKSVLLFSNKIEVESEIKYKNDSWNHALVPDEKLAKFLDIYLEVIKK